MKIIEPNVELIKEENILKQIERCGRICYKSEDKIVEGSAEKFVSNIIKRGHEAVLEHGYIILDTDEPAWMDIKNLADSCEYLCYGYHCYLCFAHGKVSGNIRAWRDLFKSCQSIDYKLPLFLKEALIDKYPVLFAEFFNKKLYKITSGKAKIINKEDLTSPLEIYAHYPITAVFTCDRGVSHEIVRHRKASFCQESTRYCSYMKEKFGNEITVIAPSTFDSESMNYDIWKKACERSEEVYFILLNSGASPQEARSVLPNSLKTEVAMTATVKEWEHFFKLRCVEGAHPDMRISAKQALEVCKKELPILFYS